jgi:hypothetical protein
MVGGEHLLEPLGSFERRQFAGRRQRHSKSLNQFRRGVRFMTPSELQNGRGHHAASDDLSVN